MHQTLGRTGWFNVYKPKFLTSNAVIGIIRKQIGLNRQIKIGHAGTLDPLAEGVLPVAIGQATKLISFMMDQVKRYRFTIQFGTRTDTADAAGQIIATTSLYPSAQDTAEICPKFCGDITQIPPKFSAIKIAGRRAYDLARASQEFIMPSRDIKIFSLRFISYQSAAAPSATYEVACSKGTYIRSLAEDMSQALDTLGFITDLVRLAVGPFDAAEATVPQQLSWQALLPLELAILRLPVIEVDETTKRRIQQGQRLRLKEEVGGLHRIHCAENLIAIGYVRDGIFQPTKVLAGLITDIPA